MDEINLSSAATVGCDMEVKVIGGEKETEDQQSLEVLTNAVEEEQKSQKSGCESESIVSDLKVDEATWNYIQRTPVYAEVVKKVQSETQVIIVHSGSGLDTVEITGDCHDVVMKAKVEIESILRECKHEVRTVILQKLDQEMYSQVISFLEDCDAHSRCTFTLELQSVFLTGKAKDIDQLLGLLEETFGVTGAMPLSSDAEDNPCPTNEQSDEIQDARGDHLAGSDSKQTRDYEPSGKSLKSLNHDEVDTEFYETEKGEFIELEDDALTVDEKIWCYMEKHPDYIESVKLIKDKSSLSVMPEPVKSGLSKESSTNRVRLVFTGSDEAEVRASVHRTKSIIKQCQGADTKTLRVPCPDRAVHQKITKLLKAINRLPSYVAVEPEMIAITGNTVEIENCLEKLKTYGLLYEIPESPKECTPGVGFDGSEHRPDDEVVGATENSGDFEHYRQLPVPIEEFLWLYINRRKQQELNELRKDYNLQIIADGADMPDFVSITLASNSTDMLDCGHDAIVSLIVHLRQQIVFAVMDTASPEDLPQELQAMLQQQCRDMESVIVVKGSKICIIGPNEEAMKCQQLIASFMQNAELDARKMGLLGHDTANMTSVGYSEELETAGDTLNHGYHGERSNGTLLDNAILQKEETKCDDAELRYAGGDGYGTFQKGSEAVAEVNDAGVSYRESRKRTDHEVAKEVFSADTTVIRQQKQEGNSYEESTLNGLHINKMSNSNHASGSHLEEEQNGGVCSICHGDRSSSSNQREVCHHHYCLSCVDLYFGEQECPVCGTVELSSKQKISQPENGLMLTTYDNSFKLPGYENSSRGTIVVTYAFPPGIQSEELPNPGRSYPGLTTTAFFPMCLEGSSVVDLLQRAFEKRLVFKISQNQDSSNGSLVWNGILHKVNIFGGPKQNGYPDPIYLRRISNDLAVRGIRDTP